MNDQYEEHGFFIVKNFIPRVFADYLKQVLHTLMVNSSLENGDAQVSDSLCVYGNPAFDTFGFMSTPIVSKVTGKDLSFTYTYARIYLNNAHLLPHFDRPECEHSVSLFLGGDYTHLWPLWLQRPDKHKTAEMCVLEEGDAVIYKGNEVYHWRDHFNGVNYYQLFMHYVNKDGLYKDKIFDTRPYLGLPSSTKRDYGHTQTQ